MYQCRSSVTPECVNLTFTYWTLISTDSSLASTAQKGEGTRSVSTMVLLSDSNTHAIEVETSLEHWTHYLMNLTLFIRKDNVLK